MGNRGKKRGKGKGQKPAAASGGGAAAQAPAAQGPLYKQGAKVQVRIRPEDAWQSGNVVGYVSGKPRVALEDGDGHALIWPHVRPMPESPESTPPASAVRGSPPGSTARSLSGGTGATEDTDRAHTDHTGAPPDPPAAPSLAQSLTAAPAPAGGGAAAEPRQGLAPGRDHSEYLEIEGMAVNLILTAAAAGAEAMRARLAADPQFAAAAEALRGTSHRMRAHLMQVYAETNEHFAEKEGKRRQQIDEQQEAVRQAAWDNGLRHAQAAMLSRVLGGGAANPPPAAAAAGGGAPVAAAAGAPMAAAAAASPVDIYVVDGDAAAR